jgi:mRNA interferase YafQ
MDLIDDVIFDLANEKKLAAKYKDHALSNNWKGFRDCHIKPDLILIYRVIKNALSLELTRTGSYSELF